MGIGLTTYPTPGKSIVGYKIYRNTTDIYVGASAGLVNYKGGGYPYGGVALSDGKTYAYIPNASTPMVKSGTLTHFYLGVWYSSASVDKYSTITLLVCNIETGASGKYLDIVNTKDVGVYFKAKKLDYYEVLEVEIDGGLSMIAGQVLCLKIPQHPSFSNLYIPCSTYSSVYLYSDSSYTTGNTILYSAFANGDKIDSELSPLRSFEARGEWIDSWVEQVDGYVGATVITSESSISIAAGATHTIDLGSMYDLVSLRISGGQQPIEIHIRDTATDPWVSVYYGNTYNYGSSEPQSSGSIGFPYRTRHIKFTNKHTSIISFNFTYYEGNEIYNGSYFPASGSFYDLITLGVDTYPTIPYWYSIIPVDVGGTEGAMSVPVSNRLNIT